MPLVGTELSASIQNQQMPWEENIWKHQFILDKFSTFWNFCSLLGALVALCYLYKFDFVIFLEFSSCFKVIFLVYVTYYILLKTELSSFIKFFYLFEFHPFALSW